MQHPHKTKISNEWAEQVVTSDTWNIGKPVRSGGTSLFLVERYDGVLGYAKLAFQEAVPGVPIAAHEKIAADLGHKLEIPVAPSILWQCEDGRLFSISLSIFRRSCTWREAKQNITPQFLNNVSHILAAGFVFHSWIGDMDHVCPGDNVIVDAECNQNAPAIAFIDHAFSMAYSWGPVPTEVKKISPYFEGGADPSLDHITKAVERIQNFPEHEIKKVVQRIPENYLDKKQSEIIIHNLIQRQCNLDRSFSL